MKTKNNVFPSKETVAYPLSWDHVRVHAGVYEAQDCPNARFVCIPAVLGSDMPNAVLWADNHEICVPANFRGSMFRRVADTISITVNY